VSLLETAYALMIVVSLTVQGLFSLPYLLMETVHRVHRPSEMSNLSDERLVSDMLQCIIDFMAVGVLTAEVSQLFASVIRYLAWS
jgi:hypothetical protein